MEPLIFEKINKNCKLKEITSIKEKNAKNGEKRENFWMKNVCVL